MLEERSPKASERVARRVVHDMLEQGLEPGDRLPSEAAMIEEYQVARGTIREALRILEVHGILHLRQGKQGGPIVSPPSTQALARMVSLHLQLDRVTLKAVCEARVALEPVLAELAATQPPEATQVILEVVERSKNYDLSNDKAYVRASSEFHSAVAEAAGNEFLTLTASVLRDLFTRRVTYGVMPTGQRGGVIECHDQIARAIRSGKATTARNLMRQDMNDWYTNILAAAPALLNEPIDWD